jgi:hypothetical protein
MHPLIDRSLIQREGGHRRQCFESDGRSLLSPAEPLENTEGGILCLLLVRFGTCSSVFDRFHEGHGEQQQQRVGGEGCVRGGVCVDWCV